MTIRLLARNHKTMPSTERALRTEDLLTAAERLRNDIPGGVQRQLHELERAHGMTTTEMLTRRQLCVLTDDVHVTRWLLLARAVRLTENGSE